MQDEEAAQENIMDPASVWETPRLVFAVHRLHIRRHDHTPHYGEVLYAELATACQQCVELRRLVVHYQPTPAPSSLCANPSAAE
jgi:hypothetical protein